MNAVIIAILIFLNTASVWAAPAVTEVTGTVTNGSTLTITGTGFGTKSTAAPLVWDNFEAGTAAANIAGNSPVIGPAWTDYSNNASAHPTYNTASEGNRTNSTKSSFHDFTGAGVYNISLKYSPSSPATFYLSFWWKYIKTSTSCSRNIKPWVIYGTVSSFPSEYVGYGDCVADPNLRTNAEDSPNPTNSTMYGADASSIANVESEWQMFEVYLVQSAANVSDGKFKVWIYRPFAGSPTVDFGIANLAQSDAYMTRTTSNTWNELHLGGAFLAQDTPADARGKIYLDNVYLDTTLSRVMICKESTFSARKHCEHQVPSSWSGTSVVVTVNNGAMASGDTKYLYVADSTGATNATGFLLSAGSGGEIGTSRNPGVKTPVNRGAAGTSVSGGG